MTNETTIAKKTGCRAEIVLGVEFSASLNQMWSACFRFHSKVSSTMVRGSAWWFMSALTPIWCSRTGWALLLGWQAPPTGVLRTIQGLASRLPTFRTGFGDCPGPPAEASQVPKIPAVADLQFEAELGWRNINVISFPNHDLRPTPLRSYAACLSQHCNQVSGPGQLRSKRMSFLETKGDL